MSLASPIEPHLPMPSVLVCQDEIRAAETGIPLYAIIRQPTLMVVKSKETGQTLGTIRFGPLSTDTIELTINGVPTHIQTGWLHSRMRFQSTISGEKWYWKNDKATGGLRLEDSKRGNVLAKVDGEPANMLTCENETLDNGSYAEILLSAIAAIEAGRRFEIETSRPLRGESIAHGRPWRSSFGIQRPVHTAAH